MKKSCRLPWFAAIFWHLVVILQDSSDLSRFLHDNLHVHGWSTGEPRDRERDQGRCGACSVHLSLLKQEAVHLALSRAHSLSNPFAESGFSTAALLGQNCKYGDKPPRDAVVAAHQPRSGTHSPHSPRTPQRTPQTLRRRGPKLPNYNMDRWVEEQQQLVASKCSSDGVAIYHHHQVPLKALPPLNQT